jgi:rhodanese-related sulfurtransferase
MKNFPEKRKKRNLAAAALMVAVALVVYGWGSAPDGVKQLGAREAADLLSRHQGDPTLAVIDMRTPTEYRQGHIAGARLVDFYDPSFKSRLDQLDRQKAYLVYCRSGNRTGKALALMKELGFQKVYHLKGGILDWNAHRLPLAQPQ